MVTASGRSGADAPSGHSAEPEPISVVSAVPASVLNADTIAARLADPDFQREQAAQLLAAEIGFQMRVARIESGLTVEEVAARAYATPRAVRTIERGEAVSALRPLTDMATKLGCRLGVRIEKPAASAIEAPSGGETPKSGPTEGESAVPKGDAQ